MNFLQLAQKLRQECGVAGTGPLSVVNQNNEAKRLVDYINDAWVEIQGLHDNWGFLREDFSFQATIGVGDYTPAAAGLTDWKKWHTDTFRVYRTADGTNDEMYLVEWDYQIFRNTYRYGPQTPGRPTVFTVRPKDKAIMLGLVPETTYTVVGEYQRVPQRMTQDTDIPPIPQHLHLAIVYKAMEFYGLFEAASEVMSRGQQGYSQLMAQLEREELPDLVLGEPLA